jgi:hypothetical protein
MLAALGCTENWEGLHAQQQAVILPYYRAHCLLDQQIDPATIS